MHFLQGDGSLLRDHTAMNLPPGRCRQAWDHMGSKPQNSPEFHASLSQIPEGLLCTPSPSPRMTKSRPLQKFQFLIGPLSPLKALRRQQEIQEPAS